MSEDIQQWYGMSDLAILSQLGKYIHDVRLSKNKTQQELADAAGINRSTLVQFEKGKGANLLTFIQVLRALDQLQLLQNFHYKMELSPMKLAELEQKMRKRARNNSSNNKEKNSSTW